MWIHVNYFAAPCREENVSLISPVSVTVSGWMQILCKYCLALAGTCGTVAMSQSPDHHPSPQQQNLSECYHQLSRIQIHYHNILWYDGQLVNGWGNYAYQSGLKCWGLTAPRWFLGSLVWLAWCKTSDKKWQFQDLNKTSDWQQIRHHPQTYRFLLLFSNS